MLTCVEMAIFAVVFIFVFPVDDLWKYSVDNPEQTQPISKVGAVRFTFSAVNTIYETVFECNN